MSTKKIIKKKNPPKMDLGGTLDEENAALRGEKQSIGSKIGGAVKGFLGNTNFNTSGLIQGANALVTDFIYNPQMQRNEAERARNMIAPIEGYSADIGSDDNRFYADGGRVSAWNKFADWLGTSKLTGSKKLDRKGNKVIDDYNKSTGESITPDFVKSVQQDFLANNMVPKPSKVDGWVGSITSTYKYPEQTSNTQQSAVKRLRYEKLVDAQGVPMYSPVFEGNWTENDVRQQWAKIPESFGGIPVQRGDAWKDGWSGVKQGSNSTAWTPSNQPAQSNQSQYGGVRLATGSQYGQGGKVDMTDLTSSPWEANALVEAGEVVKTPDDVTTHITGDKHSDPSGGEFINVPQGTQVYSDKLKLSKEEASEILGRKINKKMTIAQVAKKFDTSVEEETLTNRGTDKIAKRTAAMMKEIKNTKLEDLFNRQEAMKPKSTQQVYAAGGTIPGTIPGTSIPFGYDDANIGITAKRKYPGVQSVPDHLLSMQIPTPGIATPDLSVPMYNPTGPTTSSNTKPLFNTQGLRGSGAFLPEAVAAINNLTDQPIFSARYTPTLMGPAPELGISGQLDRNYAQTRGYLDQSSGNQSVDAARGAQALSNLYDANNQVYSQKYNADTQSRYRVDAQNVDILNQAQDINLRRADDFWNKVTQRKANKDATNNAIASSVYAKSQAMKSEQASLKVAQELYPNYRYNQQQGGFEYVTDKDGNRFMIPVGSRRLAFDPNDGIRTSQTIKVGGKTYKQTEDPKK